MSAYKEKLNSLIKTPKKWLITGVSGFIGSNLLEHLLKIDQEVVGLDNFVTGKQSNLDEVKSEVSNEQWQRFTFISGDIRVLEDCQKSCSGVDFVLHQAALGSVPRSVKNPIATNEANISGFLNMLVAAREANVQSFTYAASSSTYGDHPALPKLENNIGRPLSPYAVTKYVNELYSNVFSLSYGFNSTGLRYFNVFGKRQDPSGAYAAVIPKWISSMINNYDVEINGDGETSRDFCFIENVVQANILAATHSKIVESDVYNVAFGGRTTLNDLFDELKCSLSRNSENYERQPIFKDFRAGDVRHSQADISKAKNKLGYIPEYDLKDGIAKAMPWYIKHLK